MREGFGHWTGWRWAVAAGLVSALAGPAAAQVSGPVLLAQLGDSGGVDYPSRRRSFTEAEFQRLPDVCRYMQGYGYETPRGVAYRQQIGVALEHVHHYCRGLRDMFFARFAPVPPDHRRGLWSRALGEVDYMIKNTPQTNLLMPEFWYQRGEILLALGDMFEAQRAFEQSRQLKPDYWPAYTSWADFLIQNRRFDEARAVIDLGLQNAPDTPQLLQRKDRLAQQQR